MPRRPLAPLAALNPSNPMKPLIHHPSLIKLLLIFGFWHLNFCARAWTITNILIGVDSNSNAWSKVNNNNNGLVGWANQLTASNNLFAIQIGALRQAANTNGVMNFDRGRITSDGGGDVTISGALTANGPVTFGGGYWLVDAAGNTTFNGSATFNNDTTFSGQVDASTLEIGSLYISASGYAPVDVLDLDGGQGQASFLSGNVQFVNGPAASGPGLINFGNDGSASFLNGGATITADSSGHGGTTLMLNASDTGIPMYLHVTSAGVATWTTAP